MSLDIEDDMAKVYTRKCFYEVQEQLKESFKYKLELLRENEIESMFKVIRKNIDTSNSREYILKRWTKVARQSVVLDSNGVEIKDNKALFVRRTKLLQHATYAIDKAIVSDEASQLLMESLDAFLEKFNRLSNGNLAPVLETETPTIQHVFNVPDEIRAKGCGKRLRKGKEKRKGKVKESQGRKCHGCGLYGQSHDKRNCPRLLAIPAISKDEDSISSNMDDDSCSSTDTVVLLL
ncbi:hypothetical protein ACLB2K_028605 [Fragaria x ananassa]